MTSATTVWQGQAHLLCLTRTEETEDCASFIFAVPEGTHLQFQPGQFVCLGTPLDGQLKMRAYSIASDNAEITSFRVAVRRVPGGLVSNWLLDRVSPGTQVEALAPAGDFHLDTGRFQSSEGPAHVLLFSAGCGITPMLSMAYWLCTNRPDVQVHFIHSARDEAHLILAAETAALARNHPNFRLHRFLSHPLSAAGGYAGRINAEVIEALLPGAENLEAYLCGPQAYMQSIANVLLSLGVAEALIHRESFFTPSVRGCRQELDTESTGQTFSLEVPAFGKTLHAGQGDTLLDVLERAGLPIIGACRSGVCGSCRCRVSEGPVETTAVGPLTEAEQDAGYVLACSTHLRGNVRLDLS